MYDLSLIDKNFLLLKKTSFTTQIPNTTNIKIDKN